MGLVLALVSFFLFAKGAINQNNLLFWGGIVGTVCGLMMQLYMEWYQLGGLFS